jgi:hypothetical protein
MKWHSAQHPYYCCSASLPSGKRPQDFPSALSRAESKFINVGNHYAQKHRISQSHNLQIGIAAVICIPRDEAIIRYSRSGIIGLYL